MEPIAVLYWVDNDGVEHSKKCFNHSAIERNTWFVTSRNFMSWICLCNVDTSIPLRPPKRHDIGA